MLDEVLSLLLLCRAVFLAVSRSMYAVAANCPDLEVLTLGGYTEHVTDGGITVLLEACPHLHTVKLSSKLLKVRRPGWGLHHQLVCPPQSPHAQADSVQKIEFLGSLQSWWSDLGQQGP